MRDDACSRAFQILRGPRGATQSLAGLQLQDPIDLQEQRPRQAFSVQDVFSLKSFHLYVSDRNLHASSGCVTYAIVKSITLHELTSDDCAHDLKYSV